MCSEAGRWCEAVTAHRASVIGRLDMMDYRGIWKESQHVARHHLLGLSNHRKRCPIAVLAPASSAFNLGANSWKSVQSRMLIGIVID